MEALLDNLVPRLNLRLDAQERESEALGSPLIFRGEVTLLGQFALLCQPSAAELLTLRATRDIDALIRADGGFTANFRIVVNELGFDYDDLSPDVWIPEGASYNMLYESRRFSIRALDPISVLISKAVKARERNRILIREAIKVYGDPLIVRLNEYQVELSFFVAKKDKKGAHR